MKKLLAVFLVLCLLLGAGAVSASAKTKKDALAEVALFMDEAYVKNFVAGVVASGHLEWYGVCRAIEAAYENMVIVGLDIVIFNYPDRNWAKFYHNCEEFLKAYGALPPETNNEATDMGRFIGWAVLAALWAPDEEHTGSDTKWWEFAPSVMQWILKWIFFGWIWMKK